MNIKSINITEGLFNRKIEFSERVNLIHSNQNSKGKTTLLRFLLYSLGYNIPNTRNIKFEHCEVKTIIWSEISGDILLTRNAMDYIVATINSEMKTFILPEQQHDLHELIFGTDKEEILDNLLGAFYVDQEKGWTLLNRGVAIGSIHFNIEELIRGLSGVDCSTLIRKEEILSRELGKYRQMFSVAKYKEAVETEIGSVAVDAYTETIDAEYEQLLMKQQSLKKELQRLDHSINDNKHFSKFILEMKLLIKAPNGTTIPVTKDNIIGYEDNIEYLITKRKLVSSDLATTYSRLNALQNKQDIDNQQLAFWESETLAEVFDRRMATLPTINTVVIDKEIKRLEKELKAVRQSISDNTKSNNPVASALYNDVLQYAVELGVGTDKTMAASYIFTSNLKELSGAVLHKTVFAFRLAYIIEIEKALNIKLPIILDSPSGKEIDQDNIQLMIDILKRDFSENQIIIASIFEYTFDYVNKIEIVNRLIEPA